MKRVSRYLHDVGERIREASAAIGRTVVVDAGVLDRSQSVALQPPGAWSANQSCQLIAAADGWVAVNLPRDDDFALLPALLETYVSGEPWAALNAAVKTRACADLIARADLLGLAIAQVGETKAGPAPCRVQARAAAPRTRLRVLDLSSLWAGPLCGSIFAAMGAEVIKLESTERPDATAHATPLLDQRLNGGKRRASLAFGTEDGRAALLDEIARSDVLITSARARALAPLGIERPTLETLSPNLIWIAVSGHGGASNRVAFGDDAAAAGGLVAWDGATPRFIGDALADPLTGLAAAAAALEMIARNEAGVVDAALAHTAAFVAGASP